MPRSAIHPVASTARSKAETHVPPLSKGKRETGRTEKRTVTPAVSWHISQGADLSCQGLELATGHHHLCPETRGEERRGERRERKGREQEKEGKATACAGSMSQNLQLTPVTCGFSGRQSGPSPMQSVGMHQPCTSRHRTKIRVQA